MSASTSSNAVPLPKPKKIKEIKKKSSGVPLGKFLASSEKVVRDKAVSNLSNFLSGSKKKLNHQDDLLELGDLNWDKEFKVDSRLAPLEMAKLWKGIFYCFWMSDKPLIQQALASNLALLSLDVRPKSGPGRSTGRVERVRNTLCYLKGFWEAVVREWGGLDRLRLDKFYLLIRRFVHAGFLLLKREEYDPRAIEEYNAILTGPGGALHVLDSRIPHSLCYHLADIYTFELEASLSSPLLSFSPSTTTTSSPPPSIKVPLLNLLEPFYLTITISQSQAMFNRIIENVFDPIWDCTLPQIERGSSKRRKLDADDDEESSSRKKKDQFNGIIELSIEGDAVEGEAGEGEGEERRERVGKKVLDQLFKVGGQKLTGEVTRRKIYKVCRARSGEEE